MEAMRQSWTDDRLDDLGQEFAAVRQGMGEEFAAVHDEFAAVRKEMKDEFKAVRQELKDGFDGIQKLMIRFMGIVVVALFGLVGSLIGLVAVAVL